jgi:ribA/ribD-fused uncharacterized protein
MPHLIDRFSGRWAFLSNFHRSGLVWEGDLYPTAEHAFNAGKTLDRAKRREIASAPTPGIAKRMGRARSIQLREGWDERVRYEVMASVLRAKFCCDPRRTEALLSTGDAMLVEGNSWHDQHWGDCRCGRQACADPGGNHLGRLLMELRAALGRVDHVEPHDLAHQYPPHLRDPECSACRLT